MADLAQNATGALFAARAQAGTAGAASHDALARGAQTPEQIETIAEDFEAMFLAQMLAPVFSSIKTDGPFGGGEGEDAFRTILHDHYAKAIAERGGIGIAEQVKTGLLKLQAAAQNANSSSPAGSISAEQIANTYGAPR